MTKREPISVCIATYNGSKYIEIQLKSILKQLNPYDEVIIVDDSSTDDTVNIIDRINSHVITTYKNENNLRHVKSFEKAISLAKNNYIYLSDQDDIWTDSRVEIMYNALSNCYLVTGNSLFCDSDGKPLDFKIDGVKSEFSNRKYRNIISLMAGESSYFGCTMAFRKEIGDLILPFPPFIESHDQWIAFCANLSGFNKHLDDNVLIRRIHGLNESYKYRSLFKKLKSRYVQILMICCAYFRIYG